MLNRLSSISVLSLLIVTSSGFADEDSEPPEIAKKSAISASLQAMQNNGVMNRVQQQTQQASQARLSRNNALAARAVVTENPPVPIKHVLVCETEANCQSASDWGNGNGFNATSVNYATWMPDLDPLGENDQGAE